MSKTGCEKCDFTGFSYGKIPCVCVEDAPPQKEKPEGNIFVDHSKYAPHINGIPVDIDNQFKPDTDDDGEGGYGCLNLTFPANDRDSQIIKVSLKNGNMINIGDHLYIGDYFVGYALGPIKDDGTINVGVGNANYRVDAQDIVVRQTKYCKECGHSL